MREHISGVLSLQCLPHVLVVDQTHKHSASIYADEWDDAGILHYRGTGLHGDQNLDYEGNRWLRDASAKDTGVFLFEKGKNGRFRFRGQVELADEPYRRREPDIDGESRWVWVFPLRVAAEDSTEDGAAPDAQTPVAGFAALQVVPDVPRVLPDPIPLRACAEGEVSHDQVQWTLLEMGARLGLDVWVARNDHNKSFDGHAFQDAPRLRESLPRQFEPQVMSLIEHIDVLWLRGNRVEAAFEVEHTTAVYSGLLRMADLVTLHPNLMIRLYIVAPDARKSKVMNELVRPTFDALEPPLRTVCGFIPYSRLFSEADSVRRYGDQLKPGFLNGIAEYAPDAMDGFRSA